MKVVVVIPTYNEADNIEQLLHILDEELRKDPDNDYSVLVVDGNSPDGTGDVVKRLSEKYPYVHLLLEKEKAGIGAAYIYGFKHAMNEMAAEVVVEMDADLQHDPKDVTRLVKEINNGSDYAIGSRFVKGGSIPEEWEFYRKLLSVGGSLFSKFVLGIFNVNDFTTGYKASRVKGFMDKLDFDSVSSKSFAYKIDLLFKMHQLGAKITEVPIVFGLRTGGVSKIENNTFFDSLKVVLMLRYNASKSFIKFCVVGFVGLFVDTGLFNFLRISLLSSRFAALTSGFVAMFVTFLLNNYWSFNDRRIETLSSKIKGFAIYLISSSIPIFVRSKLVAFGTSWFGDTLLVSNMAFFIGVVFGLIWNFVVYSRFIWKKK